MTLKQILLMAIASMGIGATAQNVGAGAAAQGFPPVNQDGKTAIVAHRGFWNCEAAGFAENSIASLREAQNSGFWGSECDVHITADDVLLVHHDEHIGMASIQRNPASAFADHRLKNGESVPTLDEYLAQAQKCATTVLVIELKPQYSQEREDKLIELSLAAVKAHGLYDPSRVAFISFSLHICEVLARECPQFMNQYLSGNLSPEELLEKGINGLDYNQAILLDRDKTMVQRAHSLGMSTNIWTVNSPQRMQQAIDQGIDAITTNEPLTLRELLGEKEFRLPAVLPLSQKHAE